MVGTAPRTLTAADIAAFTLRGSWGKSFAAPAFQYLGVLAGKNIPATNIAAGAPVGVGAARAVLGGGWTGHTRPRAKPRLRVPDFLIVPLSMLIVRIEWKAAGNAGPQSTG